MDRQVIERRAMGPQKRMSGEGSCDWRSDHRGRLGAADPRARRGAAGAGEPVGRNPGSEPQVCAGSVEPAVQHTCLSRPRHSPTGSRGRDPGTRSARRLALEAPAQLEHQCLVGRSGVAIENAVAGRLEQPVAQRPRRERLDRALHHTRRRSGLPPLPPEPVRSGAASAGGRWGSPRSSRSKASRPPPESAGPGVPSTRCRDGNRRR